MSEEEIRRDIYPYIRERIFEKIGDVTILDLHGCITNDQYAAKYHLKDLSSSNKVTIDRCSKPLYGNVNGSKFAYSALGNKIYVMCLYYFSQEEGLLFNDGLLCRKADDGSVSFAYCEGAFWPITVLDIISKPYRTKEEAFENGVKSHRKRYENIKITYQYMLDNISEVFDDIMSCNQLEDRYPNLDRQDFIDKHIIPKLMKEMEKELEGFDFL